MHCYLVVFKNQSLNKGLIDYCTAVMPLKACLVCLTQHIYVRYELKTCVICINDVWLRQTNLWIKVFLDNHCVQSTVCKCMRYLSSFWHFFGSIPNVDISEFWGYCCATNKQNWVQNHLFKVIYHCNTVLYSLNRVIQCCTVVSLSLKIVKKMSQYDNRAWVLKVFSCNLIAVEDKINCLLPRILNPKREGEREKTKDSLGLLVPNSTREWVILPKKLKFVVFLK